MKKAAIIVAAILLPCLLGVAVYYNMPSVKERRISKELEKSAITYIYGIGDYYDDLRLVPPGDYDDKIPNGSGSISWGRYKTNFQKNGGNKDQLLHGCFTYTNVHYQLITIYMIWNGEKWESAVVKTENPQ